MPGAVSSEGVSLRQRRENFWEGVRLQYGDSCAKRGDKLWASQPPKKPEEYNDTIYAKRLVMVYIPSFSHGGWEGLADFPISLIGRLGVLCRATLREAGHTASKKLRRTS